MKEFSILFFLLMFLNHTLLFFYHLQKFAVKKQVMCWKKITKTFSVFCFFFFFSPQCTDEPKHYEQSQVKLSHKNSAFSRSEIQMNRLWVTVFDAGEMLMVMVIVRQMGQSIFKMARFESNT